MSKVESSLKSISLVSGLSFARLVVQFVLQVLLAKYFGASKDMDAFVAVLAFPTVVSMILGGVPYAFIPSFVDRRERVGQQAAWTMVGNVVLLVGGATLCLAAVACWQAELVVKSLFPGFSGEKFETAVKLFRILVWLVLSNGLLSVVQAVNHAMRRFGVPEASLAVGSLFTLLFIVWRHESDGILAVGWGVLLGSVTAVVCQSDLLVRHLRQMKWQLDEGTLRWMRLVVPLVLGAAYYKLDPLVDRYLASHLPEGNIAHLGYAWRILNALLILGTTGLSVVAFPALAKHASLKDERALQAEIAHAFRFLCFVLVPVTFGLLFYGRSVVHDLYERGKFLPTDTQAVAVLLIIYLGTLWGASLGEVAAKMFYAVGNTVLPILVGVCGFTVGAVLKILCVPYWGVNALAAATSFYYLGNSLALLAFILRRWHWQTLEGVAQAVGRYILASAAATGLCWFVVHSGIRFSSFYGALLGAIVYLSVAFWQKDEFAGRFYEYVQIQVKRLGVFFSGPKQ